MNQNTETQITLTELEKKVLARVQEGSDGERNICWLYLIEEAGIFGKRLSGVISSLTKKGAISTYQDGSMVIEALGNWRIEQD